MPRQPIVTIAISSAHLRDGSEPSFDSLFGTKGRTTGPVTAVHKRQPLLKFPDGLFLEVAQKRRQGYRDIGVQLTATLTTSACRWFRRPEEYDVLRIAELYGDIISDLCAGLVGGLGLAPAATWRKGAVFEPVHGSAPRYPARNRVNPTATILTGA